jgi:hypothetical protein
MAVLICPVSPFFHLIFNDGYRTLPLGLIGPPEKFTSALAFKDLRLTTALADSEKR